jgi:maltose O-acetyltransferase
MKEKINNFVNTYILHYNYFRLLKKLFIRFFGYYLINTFISGIPVRRFRKFYYRCWGMKIGANTTIGRNFIITNPEIVKIGNNSGIGWNCHFQGLGGITIGNNVAINSYTRIWTGTHEINSPNFSAYYQPVVIEDYVWVSTGFIILQGVNIGEGAVVMAGAVVTKDIRPYNIVAGVPAEVKGERARI